MAARRGEGEGEGGQRRPLRDEEAHAAGRSGSGGIADVKGGMMNGQRARGATNHWSRSHLLLLACLLGLSGVAESANVTFFNETEEQRTFCALNGCMPPPVTNLVVGEHVTFNITAYIGAGINASIAVLTDPGLPNECTVTEEMMMLWRNNTANDEFLTYRTVSFTPAPPQAGITYKLCFRAYDAVNGNNTATLCHTVAVAGPVPSFDMNLTTSPGTTIEVGVGCPVRMRLVTTDAGGSNYCTTVVSGMLDGTMIVPQLGELLAGEITAAAPRGTHDSCVASEFELIWYPRKGQEAQEYHYCVYTKDTLCIGLACEQQAVTLCYHVVVAKCKYCLGVGETIMHAAARYQTDWLQLWGANTHIRNPDHIPAYTMLTLGPTYTVQRGDTLQGITTRFGTTIGAILEANPDIEIVDNAGVIDAGNQLCLMPWVCWDETYADAAGLRTPKVEF